MATSAVWGWLKPFQTLSSLQFTHFHKLHQQRLRSSNLFGFLFDFVFVFASLPWICVRSSRIEFGQFSSSRLKLVAPAGLAGQYLQIIKSGFWYKIDFSNVQTCAVMSSLEPG